MRLFSRKTAVHIGQPGAQGVEWRDLRVSFRVEKTATPEPDKAEIQIYNLNQSSRSATELDNLSIRLFAGYVEPSLIFTGDVSRVEHTSVLPDTATKIEAEDGGRSWLGQTQETLRGPIDGTSIIRRIAAIMGVRVAHISKRLSPLQVQGSYVISGAVRDALTSIVASMGGTWAIQDGGLVVTRVGEPVARTGPVITPATGLVGSAEKTDDGVSLVCLIQPAIAPSGVFRVESKTVTGWFRATRVLHIGDNGWEQPFYTELDGVEYRHE